MVSTELSVRELVLRAQGGDMDAFEVLYSRHVGFVKGMVRRIAKPSDVEDIVQDVFVRALTRLGQLQNPARFKSWVGIIARRMIISRSRLKESSLFYTDRLDQRAMVNSEDQIDAFERTEQTEQLFSALRDLTPMYRKPVVDYYLLGYSVGEIAEALEVKPGVIRKRLHAARGHLRFILGQSNSP